MGHTCSITLKDPIEKKITLSFVNVIGSTHMQMKETRRHGDTQRESGRETERIREKRERKGKREEGGGRKCGTRWC